MSKNKVVKVIRVYEDEIIEVQWVLKDLTTFYKRYTIPPKNTREYKEEKEDA